MERRLDNVEAAFPLSETPTADMVWIQRRLRSAQQRRRHRNHWAQFDPDDFVILPRTEPLGYLEEARLFERAQSGDADAFNRLWLQYVRLALSVVNQFPIPEDILADALQEAVIGLRRAIEKFEVKQYVTFPTYAWYWMKQRVRRFLTKERFGLPLPAYLYHDYHRFRIGLHRCRSAADWFDWRDDWLTREPRLYGKLLRLHPLATARPDPAILKVLDPDGAPDGAAKQAERVLVVQEALNWLDERDRFIITRRYGLDGEEPEILAEIAAQIGLTRERVRQLQQAAEERLAHLITTRLSRLRFFGHNPPKAPPALSADVLRRRAALLSRSPTQWAGPRPAGDGSAATDIPGRQLELFDEPEA